MKIKDFTKPETSGLFSTYLALASFGLGTLILLSHLAFPNNYGIIRFGIFYVALAALANGTTFIYLIYQYIAYSFYRQLLAIRILILLSNIPVTLLYISIV